MTHLFELCKHRFVMKRCRFHCCVAAPYQQHLCPLQSLLLLYPMFHPVKTTKECSGVLTHPSSPDTINMCPFPTKVFVTHLPSTKRSKTSLFGPPSFLPPNITTVLVGCAPLFIPLRPLCLRLCAPSFKKTKISIFKEFGISSTPFYLTEDSFSTLPPSPLPRTIRILLCFLSLCLLYWHFSCLPLIQRPNSWT